MFQVFSLTILAHLLYFYVKSVLNLNMHRGVKYINYFNLKLGIIHLVRTQIFRKTKISYPLDTYTYVYFTLFPISG